MNKNDFTQAHLYFNITTNARTFGKHNDNDDVWFWQCQGVTKWTIEDEDEIVLEYTMIDHDDGSDFPMIRED